MYSAGLQHLDAMLYHKAAMQKDKIVPLNNICLSKAWLAHLF